MNLCPAEVLERRRLLTFFRVDTTADVIDANDGKLSLREAVSAANANAAFSDAPAGEATGDVLRVDQSIAGQHFALSSTLTITDDLSLLATGASFVGGAFAGPVLHVRLEGAEQVVFDAEIARDGNTPANGGGILYEGLHSGAALGLRQGRVIFNHADGDGGGLFHTGPGRSTVRDTFFAGNTADGSGGAIALTNGARMTVTDMVFQNNTSGGAGAGVFVGDTAGLTVNRTNGGVVFRGGRAGTPSSPADGGGLAVAAGGVATVTGATFELNKARGDGGGLHNAGTLDISGSTITANEAGWGGGGGSGGGLFTSFSASTTDTGNTISGNTPDDAHDEPDLCFMVTPEAYGETYGLVGRGETFVTDATSGVLGNGDTYGDVRLVTDVNEGELFLNPDGSFIYEAPTDYAGAVTFDYFVSTDCGDTDVVTATIPIQDHTPQASDDEYSTFVGNTLEVTAEDSDGDDIFNNGLLANDVDYDDPHGDLHASLYVQARHGTANVSSDGSFTYTPDTPADGQHPPGDEFYYKVEDPFGAFVTAKVTVNVAELAIRRVGVTAPITGQTLPGWVGEQFDLSLGFGGPIGNWVVDDDSIQWSIPGEVLEGWTSQTEDDTATPEVEGMDPDDPTTHSPVKNPLDAGERQEYGVDFFWLKPAEGGGARTVTLTAAFDMPGAATQTASATVDVEVAGPGYSPRKMTGEVRGVEDGNGTNMGLAIYGTNGAPVDNGLQLFFDYDYTLPAHVVSADHGIAQIVTNSMSSRTTQNGFPEVRHIVNTLDGGFPNANSPTYQVPTPGISKVDTPYELVQGANAGTQYVTFARDDQFDVYLMHKPDGPGDNPFVEEGTWEGRWVPVMKRSWKWGGAMDRDIDNLGAWTLTRGHVEVVGPAEAFPDYPEWDGATSWHFTEWS